MSEEDPLAWLNGLEGVPSAFVAARAGMDALLRDRGMRRTTAEQTTESLLRGAQASAELEGSLSTLEETRAGLGDPIVAAAVRVSAEVLGLAPLIKTAPIQAVARIHAIAAAGTDPESVIGRPVTSEAADRLQTLGSLVLTTEAPGLVIAAIAHAEIVTVAPFASYNGLVARAMERLLIAARGVDPFSVTVPEAGHREVPAEYASNLRAYATGSNAGLRAWLLYAAEAYALGTERSPINGR